MRLVGFIIRIYHDARSPERQIHAIYTQFISFSHRPHVSGMFVAHHQDVYCIYTTIGTCCAFLVGMSVGRVGLEFHSKPANVQSAKNHNTYQLLYIYSITPDDELQICPKHVEGD